MATKTANTLPGTVDEAFLVGDSPPQETRAEFEKLVDQVRRMFTGGPSLVDEYFRERDKDKW